MFIASFSKTAATEVKVQMPAREFIKEHKHLTKVLRSGKHKDELKESVEQQQELNKVRKEIIGQLADQESLTATTDGW